MLNSTQSLKDFIEQALRTKAAYADPPGISFGDTLGLNSRLNGIGRDAVER